MIGDVLAGRYKVVAKVGDGGMQAVYRAYDSLTERDVALKTPLPGQGVRRFAQSAIIAARVNNHNVAKTYDYFEADDRPFLIEEFVEGPNLSEALGGSFLEPNAGAMTFHRLALGMAASHAAGVVHRDMKPSNVIAVGGPLLKQVKITDFGIATLTEAVFEEASKLGDLTKSTSGTVKGALPYMAPEMIFRRKGEHPGASADIWSLGAMMFKLLTGIYPFGQGFDAVANVKNGEREAWPDFMVRSAANASLVAELQELVETCLTNNEAARPSALEIAQRCAALCYGNMEREIGTVVERNGNQRFLRTDAGERIFFHRRCVYGTPSPAIDDQVIFSASPGAPYRRAEPVVILKPVDPEDVA